MLIALLQQALWVLALGVPFVLFELWFAARRLSYREVIVRDMGAYAAVVLLGIPIGAVLDVALTRLPLAELLQRLPQPPPWASIPLAVLAVDFTLYWTHRALHTRQFWRMHRWHHSPRHLYWLAGMRSSFLQGLVYTSVPIACVLLVHAPPWFVGVFGLFTIVLNHWMHANVRLKARWLEAVLVTPRIHHVHHSIDPRHHDRNFGALLSVWDRIFGTYFDPDDITDPLEFGIPEVVSPPRIVLGL